MKKFEYGQLFFGTKSVTWDAGGKPLAFQGENQSKILNDFGKEGWELVSASADSTRYTFKREIETQTPISKHQKQILPAQSPRQSIASKAS
jgi:hypothetical protein